MLRLCSHGVKAEHVAETIDRWLSECAESGLRRPDRAVRRVWNLLGVSGPWTAAPVAR
jgi:hypothetical protein